jgi:hypothetical protein
MSNKIPIVSSQNVWLKPHLSKLLDWLFDEIGSSGGDGDASWVVKYYDLVDLRQFVLEWMKTNAMIDWTCEEIKENRHFTVHRYQECLIVTLGEQDVPPWSQCTIHL